jgi:molecular chaperone DnaK
VTIAASSGLSKEEIENMVQQAEQNAEEDKARRDAIEAANRADSIIHDTEKAITDFKDQLDAGEADKLQQQIQSLREVVAQAQTGDRSVNPEDVKAKSDELQQASLKLFEMVYKKVS